MTRGSIRARVRAEMIDEIKASARRQLAEDGANLSLRAIAREMGMVSSAIYRYFASRDDLLTALILDAYNALGEAAEQAGAAAEGAGAAAEGAGAAADHAGVAADRAGVAADRAGVAADRAGAATEDRDDHFGRWLAVTHAIRRWAVTHPYEYALIYGSPVPGYVAPQDTVMPSIRPVVVLGAILEDAHNAGRLEPTDRPDPAPALHPELAQIAKFVAPSISEAAMARGLIAWTELFGAISFELFGRFKNTITDLESWYDHQARDMATYLGLRESRPQA